MIENRSKPSFKVRDLVVLTAPSPLAGRRPAQPTPNMAQGPGQFGEAAADSGFGEAGPGAGLRRGRITLPNARYPFRLRQRGVEGDCIVEFRLSEATKLQDFRPVQCDHALFAEAMERVLERPSTRPQLAKLQTDPNRFFQWRHAFRLSDPQ
ncbi:MAG: hypothetical protein ACFB2Z_11475 [Maricaulaceae bacterium]